jgi:hypothetical protein
MRDHTWRRLRPKDWDALLESSFAEQLRDARGHFLPGQGGRRLGSRNKPGHAFIADLYADWIEHGIDAIDKVRVNKPEAYLKVVASLLPKQLEIRENAFDGLSDDQLAALIAYVDDAVGAAHEDESGASPPPQ